MIDSETKTLWSHLLGRAMEGELKGTELETLPGVITSWKAWKTEFPKTTVLAMSRTAHDFVKAVHEEPERFVLGLRTLKESRAYPFTELQNQPVITDVFAGEKVVVFYDAEGTGGRAFKVRVGERSLHFDLKDGKRVDRETGSIWRLDGRCESGELEGQQLEEIPAIPSFARAWAAFYPETSTFGEEGSKE